MHYFSSVPDIITNMSGNVNKVADFQQKREYNCHKCGKNNNPPVSYNRKSNERYKPIDEYQ